VTLGVTLSRCVFAALVSAAKGMHCIHAVLCSSAYFCSIFCSAFLVKFNGIDDTDQLTVTNGSVVCPSVTLVHPAKAVGWNEMPFDKDTRVVPNNIALDRCPGALREKEMWDRNPQLAASP